MGLFSIFWVRGPRRPCAGPAGPERAAARAFAQVGSGVSFGASFGVAAFIQRDTMMHHPRGRAVRSRPNASPEGALTAATPDSNLVQAALAQPSSTAPVEFTWSSNSGQINPAR